MTLSVVREVPSAVGAIPAIGIPQSLERLTDSQLAAAKSVAVGLVFAVPAIAPEEPHEIVAAWAGWMMFERIAASPKVATATTDADCVFMTELVLECLGVWGSLVTRAVSAFLGVSQPGANGVPKPGEQGGQLRSHDHHSGVS